MKKVNDSGQTLVEVAFCLGLFLLLVMGVVDFGRLYSTKVTLQNAVRQAGRYAITGQCIGSNGSCSQTRYNSIITTAEGASLGLVDSTEIVLRCADNGGGCPNGAGGPGDTVTVTVTYPFHFATGPIGKYFPGQSYTIIVSSAFTNEPFPPGQS